MWESVISGFAGGGGSGVTDILGGGGGGFGFANFISNEQAKNIGGQAGETANGINQSLPFLSSFSPTSLDPTGLTSEIGGFFEDNADWILPVAGTIAGTIFLGNPSLGNKAGHAAAGFVNATSDESGIFDLDGKETPKNGQSPLGLPSFGAGEGFLST